MKTRIEFKGFVDVYDDELLTADEARGWVGHALSRGDKHASEHSAFLGQVLSVNQVEDED